MPRRAAASGPPNPGHRIGGKRNFIDQITEAKLYDHLSGRSAFTNQSCYFLGRFLPKSGAETGSPDPAPAFAREPTNPMFIYAIHC